MKTLALVLLGIALPSFAQAQIAIDMSRVTCADYLALPPAQSKNFSAWMSGWVNQKAGYAWVDLNAYERNVASVKQWCALNPQATVMSALQRAVGQK